LHQGPTVTKFDKPSIDISMLIPLLLMAAGFQLFYLIALLMRLRSEILERERNSKWVMALVSSGNRDQKTGIRKKESERANLFSDS